MVCCRQIRALVTADWDETNKGTIQIKGGGLNGRRKATWRETA